MTPSATAPGKAASPHLPRTDMAWYQLILPKATCPSWSRTLPGHRVVSAWIRCPPFHGQSIHISTVNRAVTLTTQLVIFSVPDNNPTLH